MQTLPRALGAVALTTLAAVLPAQAGQLAAYAAENPVGYVLNTSFGSGTSAAWGEMPGAPAHAEVTRTSIAASSYGYGVAPPGALSASGSASTLYTLWDLSSNSALDFGLASGLTLSFDFTASGTNAVQPISLSSSTATFDATLYSQAINGYASGLTTVYGPVAPFPSEDYLFQGDLRLVGNYSVSFSLEHVHAATGLWTMGFGTSAANMAESLGTLVLDRVRLTEGALPGGGLAVRLETGELIVVSAVPELPAQWLLLAGLAGIGGLLRRRAQAA